MKLRYLILVFCVLSISLSGCWDAREVNSLAIVLALGIDPAGDDNYQITVQNPITEASSGDSIPSSASSFNVSSAKGRTLFEAARNLTTRLSRRNYWPHTGVVVLSDQLPPKGVKHAIDFFVRDAQRRRQVYFVLTRETAQTVLTTVPDVESYTSTAIEQMIENTRTTGYGVDCALNDFLKQINSLSGTSLFNLINLCTREMNPEGSRVLELDGTGVMYQNELMGFLSRSETRIVNMLLGNFRTGLLVFDLEGDGPTDLTLEITKLMTKFTPRKVGDSYLMEAEILIKCNIVEYTGITHLPDLPLTAVENKLAHNLSVDIERVFRKATDEIKADFLLFGNKFAKTYPAFLNMSSEEWRQIFLTAVTLEPTVKIEINSAGIILDKVF